MKIHNGDHAGFEIEHANTPLKERPDWPLPSFDARDWAEAFCKRFPAVPQDDAVGWFANALMRGYDERHAPCPASLGWMYAACCSLLDKGTDPRTVEVPALLEQAQIRSLRPRSYVVDGETLVPITPAREIDAL